MDNMDNTNNSRPRNQQKRMPMPPQSNNMNINTNSRSPQRNNGRHPSQRQNHPQNASKSSPTNKSQNRRERRRHQRQLLNTTEPTQELQEPLKRQSQAQRRPPVTTQPQRAPVPTQQTSASTSSFQGFQPHAHIKQQKPMDPVYMDSSQPFCDDAEKVKHVLEVLNMNPTDYGTVSKLFRDFKVEFNTLVCVKKRWFVIFDHSSTAIDAINIVKDSQFKLRRIDTNPNDVEMLKNNVPPPMRSTTKSSQRPLTDTSAAKRMINQHLDFNKRIERERGNYPNPSDGPPSNHSGSIPPSNQQSSSLPSRYHTNDNNNYYREYSQTPPQQQQQQQPQHQMTYSVSGSQQRYARKQIQSQSVQSNNYNNNLYDVDGYGDY